MSVRLDVAVSAIAREAGLDPDRVSQDRLNIVAWINDSRREISQLPIQLPGLEFSGEFVGVANVTAGTVAATNQQAEVTGSSTAFATAMAGRYISIDTSPWQRISYVTDTTHLTLESSWNSDTVTSKTYKIWKRDYALPPKVAHIKRIIDLSENRDPLAYYDVSEFYQKFGFGDTFSPVQAFTQFGTNDIADAYIGTTIFSVTTTAGSPIVDFSSGAIVTAIAPGDRLIIGNSTTSTAFFVDKILHDTRLAVSRVLSISTGTTSATAHSLDRQHIRLYPANDSSRVYYFEGIRKVEDLFNNADLIEEGWYNAVRKGAIAKAMGYVGSPREQQKLGEYGQAIADLTRGAFKRANPTNRLKPYIAHRYGWMQNNFESKYDLP